MDNIRIGTVNTIDYKNGILSVIYVDRDDCITQDIPFLTFNNEYKMPCVGEKVLVLNLSNGDGMGICLGTYWEEDNTPPGGKKGAYYKKINDKTSIQYDVEQKSLIIEAEHLVLKATADGVETTLKDLIKRIEKLEGGGTSG